MKILFLNPSAGLGGAERAMLEVIASLRPARAYYDVAVILGEDGPLAGKLRELGAVVMIMPFPPSLAAAGDSAMGGPAGNSVSRWGLLMRLGSGSPATAAYSRRLARAIASIAPDLIHTNGFKMHLLGIWAAPRRIPVVWHLHDFVSARPLMSRLMRRNVRRCAGIIANSNSVATDAVLTLGGERPFKTVYNAVDLTSFAPTGECLDLDAIAEMPPVEPNTVRVGLVATMARWKGHETFLQALAMLPDLNLRAYIIGGPVYRTVGSQYTLEELRQTASRLGLEDRVGFTGFVPDTALAMRALDIVVHASIAPEPFGLVIAEALACGRAVIISRAGGAIELIHENEDALAHSPGSPDELSHALELLSTDAGLRRKLGLAARRTAENAFTRPRLAGQLMDFYDLLAPRATVAQKRLTDRAQ